MFSNEEILAVLKECSPEYSEAKLLEEALEVCLEIQQRVVKYKKRKSKKDLVKEVAHLYIRMIKFIDLLDDDEDQIFVDEVEDKLNQIKRNAKSKKYGKNY